jgi:hypothetical protein
MSIRNATIALRRRKIGMSEQERLAASATRGRRDARAGEGRKRESSLPARRAGQGIHWHANWVEW